MAYIIDLFAGAGGLSLGAARAGFNVLAAVELDSHAISSHIANFPYTNHIQKDILSLNGKTLLQLANIKQDQLSGIIGGPPCQGFSTIGHGNVNDERNLLFIKFFELVGEIQPAFFVAENVPGIMNEKYDIIRARAFNHVKKYTLLPPIRIKASDYGAPTTRTRIFFVGFKEGANINSIVITDIEKMKVGINQQTNVRQALEGISNITEPSGNGEIDRKYFMEPNSRTQCDFFYQRIVGMRPNNVGDNEYINCYTNKHIVNGCLPTKHSIDVKKRYEALAYGQQDKVSKSKRLDPNGFCPTLRAGTGPEKGSYQAVRPIHFEYSRVITPREAARLQGFPDWYMLPNTIWHSFRQIGNSVSPIVAERVLSAIFQKLT